MTTKDKRVYLVADTKTGIGRLVKTISQTRAKDHVLKDRFIVRVATQDDIVKAMQATVPVEELDDKGELMNTEPVADRRAQPETANAQAS